MSVVLLIQSAHENDHHATLLRRAGVTVEVKSIASLDDADILLMPPALIAIELESERSTETFAAARHLRRHPQLRNTPIIVYATWLSAEHIEMAARSGLLWLQITPVDKLVAAIRGLLSATESAS